MQVNVRQSYLVALAIFVFSYKVSEKAKSQKSPQVGAHGGFAFSIKCCGMGKIKHEKSFYAVIFAIV